MTQESRPHRPAVALAAVPGRRRATLELAREVERRGFAGVYCASFGDGLGLSEALALSTERVGLGTMIANLHARALADYAQTASLVHELSGGRFHFGVGVSHAPINARLGVSTGRPLADARAFAERYRKQERFAGPLPPLVLAALRRKMVRLAGEVADGVVFANVSRSHVAASLAELPDHKRNDPDFFVGNMIPVCISEDREAARARNKKTLLGYVTLPNYRNYWREAGYVEEMDALEEAVSAGRREALPGLMSDAWLRDSTLYGSAAEVREGVEAWLDAGVRTPMLVPSSAAGNQMKAFEELLAAFA